MESVDVVDPLAAAIAGSSRFGSLVLDACSRVDRFVLEHFIRRPAVAPPRGLRARLARAAAFYGDERFVAEPETFFAPPGPLRRVDMRRLVWLPGGELVELSYETDFEPVFPEARASDAASRRGVALWWRHGGTGRDRKSVV